jgi:hypothetical protein
MDDHRKKRGPRKPLPRFDGLADDAYCKGAQITRDVLPVSPVTLWRWVQIGKFPPPDRIGGMPFWRVGTIREWQRRQTTEAA